MLELTRIRQALNEETIIKCRYGEYEHAIISPLEHSGKEVDVDGYTFKQEEQYGGEGLGDEYWVVFSVSKDEEKEFYKIPGWYSSGNGSELEPENTFKVKSEEKIINVWVEA